MSYATRSADVRAPLGALWGKSNAGGQPNLLLQHLFDTAAVAERIWDSYLAPTLRRRLDVCCGGHGREFFVWLCALHDVGKATPAFQWQAPELAEAVRASGLPFARLSPRDPRAWRHDRAGGRIVHDVLSDAGWSRDAVGWVWPLIAGHHGAFPGKRAIARPRPRLHGHGDRWREVQRALVDIVTAAAGLNDVAAAEPRCALTRAEQLTLSGLIIMADWIASDERHFCGVDTLERVSMDSARDRAERAWNVLALRGGWRELPVPEGDVVQSRFGFAPRPTQDLVVDAASALPSAGLMVVEAPMGEGKTEAALAAAEILAARFGADGVFVGMPTQATADPMYLRVRAWSHEVAVGSQVALLHGKRMFNAEWHGLVEASRRRAARRTQPTSDEFGMDDDFGAVAFSGIDEGEDTEHSGGDEAPAEWFLGRKRGLLAPLVVGTIDQLLFAATRTKHVMVRFAGVAGKVVILDEIHAADVYMRQFVNEALRWLGQARVPVILLSATLPPGHRAELVANYLQGATGDPHTNAAGLPATGGYPSVTSIWADGGAPRYRMATGRPWRERSLVAVDVLEEDRQDPATAVAEFVAAQMAAGGCALVIRNTVARAQATYLALREAVGDDVVLLHGRLSAGHRADRTERVLELLGPSDRRPDRLVVIATQLAEQSFDVDADLLVTDLAPVDLLLQRAGRVHRHDRPADARPPRLQSPRVVVTGLAWQSDGPPWLPDGSLYIYPEYHLLRTAALVAQAAEGDGWWLPDSIPGLVAAVYGGHVDVPAGWRARQAAAYEELQADDERRREAAASYLLVRRGEWSRTTLDGLHQGHAAGIRSEDDIHRAVVRDGDDSVEVLLVRRDDRGYHSLDGTVRLGIKADADLDHARLIDVLSGTVRLPARLSADAMRLATLPEWRGRPWLQYCRVLTLDADGRALLGDHTVSYDHDLGLQATPSRTGGAARPAPVTFPGGERPDAGL